MESVLVFLKLDGRIWGLWKTVTLGMCCLCPVCSIIPFWWLSWQPKILLHKAVTLLGIFSFLIQCIFSTPRVDIINELYACENRELDSAFTSFQVFKLGFISGNLRITRWCFIFSIHVYFMSFHLCYNLEDLLINFFIL